MRSRGLTGGCRCAGVSAAGVFGCKRGTHCPRVQPMVAHSQATISACGQKKIIWDACLYERKKVDLF